MHHQSQLDLYRQEFFSKFSVEIQEHGFSLSALRHTSVSLKHDINYHAALFPEGLKQIAYFYESNSLKQALSCPALEKQIGTTKKIYEALISKIIDHGFHKNTILAIHKYYLLHGYIFSKTGWDFANQTWNIVGDTSTDYNYYTKRSLLFGVYSSATLHYLYDHSINHNKTREFIRASLDKIVSIGKASKTCKIENLPIIRFYKSYIIYGIIKLFLLTAVMLMSAM